MSQSNKRMRAVVSDDDTENIINESSNENNDQLDLSKIQERTRHLYYHLRRKVNNEFSPIYLSLNPELPSTSSESGIPSLYHYTDVVSAFLNELDKVEELYSPTTGSMVTFGNNESLQLCHPAQYQRPHVVTYFDKHNVHIRKVSAGGLITAAVSEDGLVYTAGWDEHGMLGRIVPCSPDPENLNSAIPSPLRGFCHAVTKESRDGCAINVAAGETHTLVLTEQGEVYMFGYYKDEGRTFSDIASIGASPKGHRPLPVHVFQLTQPVVQISAGNSYNAAILRDHTMVTWGMCGKQCILLSDMTDLINSPVDMNVALLVWFSICLRPQGWHFMESWVVVKT
jgi:hypothetical protein